jgi:hypothetical protein
MTRANATPFWSPVNGRVKLYAPKGRAHIVDSMSVRREVTPRINAWCVTATVVGALILGGCNQGDATARLANDLHPDKVEIIHARFSCRSPEIHFFGYRFRILVKTEMALGDICWDPLAKEWTWQILPEYGLSRLNPRK